MPSASASDQAHVEKSCVLLFISVDLVGSTAFKNERSSGSDDGKRSPAWVDVFKEFYAGFPRVFERNLDGDKLNSKLRPKLVKTIGDEILLQTEIRSSQDARRVIKFLGRALVHYKETDLSDVPLLLKGTAWIAGFPINNHRIRFEDPRGADDFIGPSIDTGFRISKASSPSRLVVSVDLAALLLEGGDDRLALVFDRTESLKGVLGGKPYPILWYHVRDNDAPLVIAELELRSAQPNQDTLKRYCYAFVDSCVAASPETWLIRPYLEGDPAFRVRPAFHEQMLAARAKVDSRNMQQGTDPPPSFGTSKKSRSRSRK